jgi:hypothetical protein
LTKLTYILAPFLKATIKVTATTISKDITSVENKNVKVKIGNSNIDKSIITTHGPTKTIEVETVNNTNSYEKREFNTTIIEGKDIDKNGQRRSAASR